MPNLAKPKRKPRKQKIVTPEQLLELSFKDEDEWQEWCINELQIHGWLVTATRRNVHLANGQHCTPTQGDGGYVDLTAARHGRVAFLELKGRDTPLKPHQVRWLNNLAGVDKSLAWWNADESDDVPNHVTRGNDSGWDVLVAVVRPRHVEWFKRELLTDASMLIPAGYQ